MVGDNSRQVNYDFEKCLEFLEEKGKEQFGAHFKVEEKDHD
jgi:hypothetical protein